MTPSGIELATFRFVAQHLNHCATAVSEYMVAKHNVLPYVKLAVVWEFVNTAAQNIWK